MHSLAKEINKSQYLIYLEKTFRYIFAFPIIRAYFSGASFKWIPHC